MTTLLDQVRAGELDKVRTATQELGERDRHRLAASAVSLLREIRQAYIGRVLKRHWPYGDDVESVLRSAQVVVLATVAPGELRKLGYWGVPPDGLALEVLSEGLPSRSRVGCTSYAHGITSNG